MFFFGAGSIVLYFINMEFILLAWVDMWGPLAAWIIRGILLVAGAVLWLVGKSQESQVTQENKATTE